MSSLGERIRFAREQKGYLQSDLAKLVGVKSSGVISNWEKDINKPDAEKIVKLCEVLSVSASFLLDYYGKTDFEINSFEEEFIKKYRALDKHGKELVDFILNKEQQRIEIELTNTSSERTAGRLIQYYQRLRSAKSGQFVFDTVPADTLEIPDIAEHQKVKYAIGVHGRSMEPEFYEGDKLLVEPADTIAPDEIGVFISDGEVLIRKLGSNELVSINKEYTNIPLTPTTRCVGRVVDKISSLDALNEKDLDIIKNGFSIEDKSRLKAENW